MTISRVRTARKRHICGSGHLIEVGARYWEHVAFPGENNSDTRPWRLRECAACGVRYDRPVTVLGETPDTQTAQEGR